MASERKSFTITWKIENATFWWFDRHTEPDELLSPGFTVNAMRGTRWKLKLVLERTSVYSYIAFSLMQETEDVGPKEMILDLELSFLGSDGSCLESGEFTKIAFSKDTTSPPLTIARHRVVKQPSDWFLPQDAFIVQCRIWGIPESEECIARTRLEVQHEIFDVSLENFSALVPAQNRPLQIRAKSGRSPPFSMYTFLDLQGVLSIRRNESNKACVCRFFRLNSAGNRERIACGDIFLKCSNLHTTILNLSRNKLMRNNKLYLPNDVLTLQMEIIFPTGVKSEEIDKPQYELNASQNISVMTPDLENLSAPHAEEQCVLPSSLKDDLMSLYNDRMFCDTKLRTEAETFPAHKSVLSARSPVFKAMFSTDMKEKASDCVDIQDLSSDTVRRMLVFLYTDTVEGLDWESARDLYIAADKYGIITLRQRCESYLKKNFCISNVCEILILADMLQQNSDLKKNVQDYILEHDVEVFGSDEWQCFLANYSLLAAETMSLKYRRNRKD